MTDDNLLLKLRRHYSKEETVIMLESELRSVNMENGKLRSYVTELEDKIVELTNESVLLQNEVKKWKGHAKEATKETKKLKLDERLIESQAEVKKLRQTVSTLISRINLPN